MSRNIINASLLSDSTNGRWDALSMSTGSTYTSEGRLLDANEGFNTLEIISTAGSLEITYELSQDNSNWYIPYDVDDNALNSIHAAITVTTGKIQVFSAQISKYIRIKIAVTSATSTVTARLITKELA